MVLYKTPIRKLITFIKYLKTYDNVIAFTMPKYSLDLKSLVGYYLNKIKGNLFSKIIHN